MKSQFRFPSDFKRLITQLSDENQWDILECLVNNENKVRYSVIQKILDIPKGTLNYHLKELQKGGWLRRKSQKGSGFDEEGSFYKINKFGLKILEGGLKAMDEKSYQTSQWDDLRRTNTWSAELIISMTPNLRKEFEKNNQLDFSVLRISETNDSQAYTEENYFLDRFRENDFIQCMPPQKFSRELSNRWR